MTQCKEEVTAIAVLFLVWSFLQKKLEMNSLPPQWGLLTMC